MRLAEDLGADGKHAVSEVYSPPRVSAVAGRLRSLGLTRGFALDLTTVDEHGEPWGFTRADRRADARRRLEAQDDIT